MRIYKGQINFDGYDLATLQTFQTQVQNARTLRLSGNGSGTFATEEIEIAGLALRAVPMEELALLEQDIANAIQKKQPGSMFTQAIFHGGSGPSAYDPYPWARPW